MPAGLPPTIMVVEDDDHIAHVLKFMFERQGYKVVAAADGMTAARLIEGEGERPDLILLDVMLPYMDGFELVQLARAKAGWSTVPILVLTARSMEQDIVRALEAGANDYIVKPFQPNELLARVRRFLAVNA